MIPSAVSDFSISLSLFVNLLTLSPPRHFRFVFSLISKFSFIGLRRVRDLDSKLCQTIISRTKSSGTMGCLLSLFRRPTGHRRIDSNLTYESTSYTSVSLELTVINESELAQILNDLHLCPFPENRAEILQSRLATRLITCTQLLQILKMLESDGERLDRLKALFGNVSDAGGSWKPIHELFEDEKLKAEAVRLTKPRTRLNGEVG
jgi:hypothetical protein